MNLSQRLKHLERRLDARGRARCTCADATPVCVVWRGDKPKPEINEQPCPRCGGVREPLFIHVRRGTPSASENAPEMSGAEGKAA